MTLTRIEGHFKSIAGALGIIQGLTYAILALICIIFYNKEAIEYDENMSYIKMVGFQMYGYFLLPGSQDLDEYFNRTLAPANFTIFAWIYFILHLGWLGVSIAVLFKSQYQFLHAWSHLTFLISVWDFITVVVLGTDFNKCLKQANDLDDIKVVVEEFCTTTIIPVLVIAARGFTLWFINVIFAFILLSLAVASKKVKNTREAPPVEPNNFPPQHYPTAQDEYNKSYSPQNPSAYGHQLSPSSYPSQPLSSYSPQHTFSYPSQHTPPSRQASSYLPTHPPQLSPPAPPQPPVAPQNGRRNQFQYPVQIPDPDYGRHEPRRF